MKTKKQSFYFGEITVTTISDYEPGITQLMDTEVRINGDLLCVIAGSEISSFISGLAQLIDEHRI